MLFTNAMIITMNPTRDIISDGAIAINGNRIVAVDKTAALLPVYEDVDESGIRACLVSTLISSIDVQALRLSRSGRCESLAHMHKKFQ